MIARGERATKKIMFFALLVLQLSAQDDLVVTLPQGQARGFTGCPQAESPLCTTAWRGLPFAAPPLG